MNEADLADLIRAAKGASERAYCPYSGFRVGAAVLTADGEVFAGGNVENASYGLTLCAERVAACRAVAERGKVDIIAVAIYTPTPRPTAPCGACRQFLREFGPRALILCTCESPVVFRRSLDELLPDSFGPDALGVDPPLSTQPGPASP